jgi:DNA modification methylase
VEIIYKKTNDLIPYANNTRTHSEDQVLQIASSIKEFGFTNPILLDDKDGVIAGHGRIMAAKKLKMDEVPTIMLEGLSEAQKKAYIIADNKLALNAGWDEELLKVEIESLQEMNFDISLLGFTEDEINDMELNSDDDSEAVNNEFQDDIPTIEEAPIIKLGDFIQLGNNYQHTVMCGDSLDSYSVEKLMDGEKADLVWTDPPYNVAIKGKAGTIKNDDMDDHSFYNFLFAAYLNYYKNIKDGGVIYVAHADSERINFTKAFIDAGFKFSQNLIWNKNSATLSRQDYNWKHEPILYGWKEGAGHYYCQDFKQTTVIEDKIDFNKMTKQELIDYTKNLIKDIKTTVIDYDRPTISELHPTMKPIGLVQHFIENSSIEKEIVLDLFGGAGSTLIACVNSKRYARIMELDEKYAQVIIQRYVDYTSNPMIKINGKEVDWNEYKESNG